MLLSGSEEIDRDKFLHAPENNFIMNFSNMTLNEVIKP